MAQRLSKKNQPPAAGNNSGQLHVIGKDAYEKMYRLDCEIRRMTEIHVEPLKKELARIRKNLKGDTACNTRELKWGYDGFKLEQDAKALENEGERNTALDGLRLAHEILERGQMVDFISVLEAKQNEKKGDATGDAESDGYRDGKTGKSPEWPDSEAYMAGWNRAQAEAAQSLNQKAA